MIGWGSKNESPASELVLLNELPNVKIGSKVRFRGCVSSYSHQTGSLYLTTTYPSPPTTAVDTALVRESVKGPTIMTGTWVNVIGYVTSTVPKIPQRADSAGQRQLDDDGSIWTQRPSSLFAPSVSASGFRAASINADLAQDGPMQNFGQVNWTIPADQYGRRLSRNSSIASFKPRSPRLSTTFSTRTPNIYQKKSNDSLNTTERLPASPELRPIPRPPSLQPTRSHLRSRSTNMFDPTMIGFASHAQKNAQDRASIASHGTMASTTSSRRGAVGARNLLLDEEEFVVARVQAVMLFSADAVGTSGRKMAGQFEDGVKARRWGMGLMREARERYASGSGGRPGSAEARNQDATSAAEDSTG